MADSLDAETPVDDFFEDRYSVFILTSVTTFVNNITYIQQEALFQCCPRA